MQKNFHLFFKMINLKQQIKHQKNGFKVDQNVKRRILTNLIATI